MQITCSTRAAFPKFRVLGADTWDLESDAIGAGLLERAFIALPEDLHAPFAWVVVLFAVGAEPGWVDGEISEFFHVAGEGHFAGLGFWHICGGSRFIKKCFVLFLVLFAFVSGASKHRRSQRTSIILCVCEEQRRGEHGSDGNRTIDSLKMVYCSREIGQAYFGHHDAGQQWESELVLCDPE